MAELPPSLLNVNRSENRQGEILKATVPFFVLAFVAVFLRFWSRLLKRAPIAADDYVIVFGLLCNTGGLILTCIGKHVVTVDPVNYIPLLKTFFAFEILYTCTITSAKLSILLFYRRIFETPLFRRLTTAVGILVLAWFAAVILVSVFSCKPVNAYWDKSILDAKCIDSRQFFLGNSIANILTDVFILALPVRMVWHLQVLRSQKVLLTLIFGLGGFVVIVSSARVAFIIEVGPDITWDYVNPVLWSAFETCTAVICACLPTLKPVVQYAVTGLRSIRSSKNSEETEDSFPLGPVQGKQAYVGGRSEDKKAYRQFHRMDDEGEIGFPMAVR
ncbi:MAG: hypothetical protein Q9220_004813 [cf. Caloplaca sp. 1 TL-2023]